MDIVARFILSEIIRCHLYPAILVLLLAMIPGAWSQEVDPGMVGWWTMDDTDYVVVDSSGTGNDANLVGTSDDWVDGYILGALDCSQGSMVEVPHSDSLSITGDLSIAAWVYLDNIEQEMGIVAKGRTVSPWSLNLIKHVSGKAILQFKVNQGSASNAWIDPQAVYEADEITIPDYSLRIGLREWVFIGITYDAEQGLLTAYINGDLKTVSKTWILGEVAEPVLMGTNGNGHNLKGRIDDVRIYNRPLCECEMKDAWGLMPKAFCPTPEDGDDAVGSPVLAWFLPQAATGSVLYLGTSENDLEWIVRLDAPLKNYSIDNLIIDHTYFWRVDTEMPDTSTPVEGDLWSFTTASRLPLNPFPKDRPGASLRKVSLYPGTQALVPLVMTSIWARIKRRLPMPIETHPISS